MTMRLSEGIEWSAHSCLNLAWAGSERPIPAARLAAYHELPPVYLIKQLQALARGGIVSSTSGPRGGFRLARPLSAITLMDVVAAIEGTDEAFECAEIRQLGPHGGPPENYPTDCALKQAMSRAELVWRTTLAEQTLADVKAAAERSSPGLDERVRRWFAAG